MDRVDFVENALGYRVRHTGSVPARGDQPGQETYQLQVLTHGGVVTRVRPASRQEFEMYTLLCTPDSDWPKEGAA